jgi:hypothetical protein
MSLKENIIKIWKAKGQIVEGITNSIFKKEDVEEIAKHRMSICHFCDLYTEDDKGCMVVGTSPCCNQDKGGCGCSLNFKTRSLSSECPKGHWKAELSQDEEDQLNQKLGI